MCFFLTVTVPAKHVERIRDVFARGFQTHPTANESIKTAFPTGYEARVTTSGMCSCDLYARPKAGADSDPTVHLRRKYEKLGWSETKIRRALEQAAANAAKKGRPVSGIRNDVTEALGALCRATGEVACVVHWYGGDVETEPLDLQRGKPCDCDELPVRAHKLIEDEVLIAAVRLAIPEVSGRVSRTAIRIARRRRD